MKKFISIMLILSTLLSLTIICKATLIADQLIDIPAEEEIMPMCYNPCHIDEDGNQYGNAKWKSLKAAKNYYGHDFTYTKLDTPIYKYGNYYTHYYSFSDGTKMYFMVTQ